MSEEIELTPSGWEALLQKAERERDEANKEALHYKTRYELLKNSMDIFNKDDGTCLDCGGPLQAVRPGKHQCNCCDSIRHLETALEETAKLAATLKQERDEARAQAREMSESNQVLLADVRFYRSACEQLKKAL